MNDANPTLLDEKRELELISLTTSIATVQALRAAIVMVAAKHFFYANQDMFFTNPANTFLFDAARALEERGIVSVASALDDENDLRTVSLTLRRARDLWRHRNSISHPTLVRWKNKDMIPFIEAERDRLDLRPALLWDACRSVHERLKELGSDRDPPQITIPLDMAAAVQAILRASIKLEHHSTIPSERELLLWLEGWRDRYLDFLVEHQDGVVHDGA